MRSMHLLSRIELPLTLHRPICSSDELFFRTPSIFRTTSIFCATSIF
jgi:hypothetical protein